MEKCCYHTGQFADKAAVSVRTLRYYDKLGLLSPAQYDASGYRLYTDEDLTKLQNILTLKFIGFSLKQVKQLMQSSPKQLQDVFAQQKAMLLEKRRNLDNIIKALEKTELLLQNDQCNYELIVKAIQVIKMGLKPEWMGKYLTTEQREYMRELALKSYSKETLQKFAERGWTEEDQCNFRQKYMLFREKLSKLVAGGAAPESPEAQEAVELLHEINYSRSKGDQAIIAGMKKSWENYVSVSDERKPTTYMLSAEERAFLKEACTIFYRDRQLGNG